MARPLGLSAGSCELFAARLRYDKAAMTRRTFLAAGAALASASSAGAASRKFTLAFTPGSIGIKTDQRGAIDLASKHGYESVQPFAGDLASMSDSQLGELKAELSAKNLQWASAGLPVDFRAGEQTYKEGMEKLRQEGPVYEKAGVTRISTWVMPCHDELTYLDYFKQTVPRLREMAKIVEDHGMRFGLEYIGTPSLRLSRRYPFVHTMAETKQLIAATGMTNIGFVLDSWHWWTSGDGKADILTLKNEDVVSADLNDAPQGLELIEQQDGSRELPAATGVIPIRDFLSALVAIGYDGPIRPEPFNNALNDMDDAAAAETAAAACKKAFATI